VGQTLARKRFALRSRRICATPALQPVPAPLTIVTMLSHRDLLMYLIAIKSLYPRLGRGTILLIDDGSLTTADRDVLNEHLGSPTIVPVCHIDSRPCPSGGTWERLLLIVARSADEYVIQMDADTLATGPLDEVEACIGDNRAFTLGTRTGRAFETLQQAADRARHSDSDHVQLVAERAMDRCAAADRRRYVRGSSGFAGFARGGVRRTAVDAFSAEMRGLIGVRWTERGSEQVASNYVIANSPAARVLPYPKYACFDREIDPAASTFLHFVGTHRFDGGVYARLAGRSITAATAAQGR
jgi:hypothetical protein